MATREDMLYAKMKKAGITEPFEAAFFFPSKEDTLIAKKWAHELGLDLMNRNDQSDLAKAIRLAATASGMPARLLNVLREFDARHKE